jgi:cation diffusion facilitator CzcD-associated flavoprotein CzcO
MSNPNPVPVVVPGGPTKTDVVIVGAGISGIAAAYYLQAQDIRYVILEADEDIGGTWLRNTWHGARVDSEVVRYAFSFKLEIPAKELWDRREVLCYLKRTVRDMGIDRHIVLRTRVRKASFDTASNAWTVETDHGAYEAQFLVNCNGFGANSPYVPEFHGTQAFRGEIIHSSRLDDGRRFDDQHVVIVGSGATAISSAPSLSDVSKSLVILQRSPSYIYEVSNRLGRFARMCRALHNRGVPLAGAMLRLQNSVAGDFYFLLIRCFPRLGRAFFHRHWRDVTTDAYQQEFLTPRYDPYTQRIPKAVGLKERISAGKIAFLNGEIDRFQERSILLRSGKEVPCDVCVLATGFQLGFFTFPVVCDGKPQDMRDVNWYKTLMMGSVPNYFHPSGCFHCSWTQRVEQLSRMVAGVIVRMRKNGYERVWVDRKAVPFYAVFSSNYLMRQKHLPRPYGLIELPTLDHYLSFRLRTSRELRFA